MVDEDVAFRLPVELRRELEAGRDRQRLERRLRPWRSPARRRREPRRDRQRLACDPVGVLERGRRRASGSVSAMRSVSSSPASLRIALSSWIRSRRGPRREVVVERRVERDGDAVLGRDRPALLARCARRAPRRAPSSSPATRKPPSPSSSKSPACERLAHGAELLAEPRSEHGQVRLAPGAPASTGVEVDVLHPQLVARSRPRGSGERRALDDEPPQRLAELDAWPSPAPGGRARRPAAPRRPRRGSPSSAAAELGPAGEEHRVRDVLGGVARRASCQRCSVRNGRIGAITRSDCDERVPERRERRARRRPRSGAASGGCTSSRGRRRTPRRRAMTATVSDAS